MPILVGLSHYADGEPPFRRAFPCSPASPTSRLFSSFQSRGAASFFMSVLWTGKGWHVYVGERDASSGGSAGREQVTPLGGTSPARPPFHPFPLCLLPPSLLFFFLTPPSPLSLRPEPGLARRQAHLYAATLSDVPGQVRRAREIRVARGEGGGETWEWGGSAGAGRAGRVGPLLPLQRRLLPNRRCVAR